MPRSLRNLLFLAACLLPLTSGTHPRAQTADSAVSLTPGPKPPDVPVEWKQLVGIYRYGQDKATVIILERDQRLFFRDSKGATHQIQEQKQTLWFDGGDGRTYAFTEDRDVTGSVTALHHLLDVVSAVEFVENAFRQEFIVDSDRVVLAGNHNVERGKHQPRLVLPSTAMRRS